MSPSIRRKQSELRATQATVFAALGDETRLALVGRLAAGEPRSIAQLAEGSPLTRQAITKHLRVLEDAGLVSSQAHGRESRFSLEPEPLRLVKDYLTVVGEQWDEALQRLKAFVED